MISTGQPKAVSMIQTRVWPFEHRCEVVVASYPGRYAVPGIRTGSSTAREQDSWKLYRVMGLWATVSACQMTPTGRDRLL